MKKLLFILLLGVLNLSASAQKAARPIDPTPTYPSRALFTSFSLVEEKTLIRLDWETVVDNDVNYFQIERSFDNFATYTIEDVVNATPYNGTYQYYDFFPKTNMPTYWRVRMYHADDSFANSELTSVLTSQFPNRAINMYGVEIATPNSGVYIEETTDATGKKHRRKVFKQ